MSKATRVNLPKSLLNAHRYKDHLHHRKFILEAHFLVQNLATD